MAHLYTCRRMNSSTQSGTQSLTILLHLSLLHILILYICFPSNICDLVQMLETGAVAVLRLHLLVHRLCWDSQVRGGVSGSSSTLAGGAGPW